MYRLKEELKILQSDLRDAQEKQKLAEKQLITAENDRMDAERRSMNLESFYQKEQLKYNV